MNNAIHSRGLFDRGPSMTNLARMLISLLPLTLAIPAYAATPADNVAWSARPVQAIAPSPGCMAYSGRPISSGEPTTTEAMLKSLGTVLVGSALSAIHGYQGPVPNPCARAGL
ncbi:hypothetical protein [Burkholderia diffusa]|uniref:hypothetical protein n=1 Tax=Burkholderia diffusa TaxID=488732 RepID=UPI002ABE7C98|nr:hypothetical protein [Burkholderia diffusa]